MKADQLQDLLLTLRFEMQRSFGLPGLLGALMIGAAAIVCASTPSVDSGTRELREMQDPARVARTANAHRPAGERGVAADAVPLDTLPGLFPGFTQSADDIAAILAQARDSNLTLGSAEYQVTTEAGAPFTRYQVLLPVKDQYSAIRRFLAAVLNNVPNAALQAIHVERPAVDGNILDARVRFELIYRTAQP
ncbi:membrane protein [Paraburkholderia caffeinilytica]|uniref:Transmembrane protein n=1 Tax=Paraburkholderia caffeinilytica TaxID=1761016 RepID=A0ABQ1N752_9BURK|nr:hypothetical protein [Paraburkholderia caffeinilytica]AXL49064.1 membrane protein [Paraburkholderia caffeinilytica]GGC56486.1 hypothetical protein GCM10011400_50190 [Paraburkholderia caffeinilytica]CAB3809630.1 hypothetical protein LMG28690_07340 [Paraburkholderia caffeinilytica]